MSANRKVSRGLKAGVAGLPREEWDFANCPKGLEDYCFHYEFARECPWIVGEYRLAMAYRRSAKAIGQHGFDERGNWHFADSGDSEMHDDWGISIQIPPGFPERPYLLTEHVPVEFPLPEKGALIDLSPGFSEKTEWLEHKLPEAWWDSRIEISVDWQKPDKVIVEQFREWLKRKRPRSACEYRGRSRVRDIMADLKALGAYRLLKNMTAEGALAYAKKFLPAGLYAKVPDWYEAKARAISVLKEVFRSERSDIGSKILADSPREAERRRKEEARA